MLSSYFDNVHFNQILLYIHDLFFHSISNFSDFYVRCCDVRELEEHEPSLGNID